jgi:periplasmic protein TonB
MAIKQFLVLAGFLSLLVCAQAQTDPAAKPKKLRVSSGVAEGLKTRNVNPKYPREAIEQGIQGDVILQATIDTKGNLTNVKVAQGDPILAKAAVEAVQQWRYRPYVLNGEPVEVETTIKIQFHM